IIFGLGQRQDPSLNQRGRDVRIWTGNTNITIPYFSSDKGYGLYWDNAGDSRFTDRNNTATFTSEVAPAIDYYFIYRDGTQDGVIAGIRSLTGDATMFPRRMMGYWQSRERYKSSDELCGVLDRYRELRVPIDGIVQDWQYWGCDSNWNAMRFMNPRYINKTGDKKWMRYLPNGENPEATYTEARIKTPREMVDYVHGRDAAIMISIWASFGPWTDQYRELDRIGALLPFETWPRNSGVKPYDAFNPKARDIYWKYLSHLYDMGFDAWWTDSTEPDHYEKPGDSDYMTHDGSWRSVKNAFALVTNKGIYEHQRKIKGNNRRSMQMTRCGTFGLQHYATLSWSGDVVTNWNVMKNQIPSGLNYVICGMPYWNNDIGGFFGWDYDNDHANPALQELQVRWMQWGTFMPMMRNHCSGPMLNEIYEFGQPGDWAFDAQKKAIELRYRLLPYIYSLAGDATQRAGTIMRPLVMDFAADKKAICLNDQYMFGRSLLVKPVTDPMYTYLDKDKKGHLIYPDVAAAAAPAGVYLPAGSKWYDFWSNELLEGGDDVLTTAP
ncbi:MAG: xylosidase, partial [Muribaculaceae bacterium]|nr:xylosidase [Muribaculaceae bacterium]